MMLRRTMVLVVALAGSMACASESYSPPEGGAWQLARVYLSPTGPFREATGVTVFACNLAETQHRLQLYAEKVRPGALYSVWIVTMDGNKVASTWEATSRWRPLRADAQGVVAFVSNLPWCPVGRDVVVVKYHPSGVNRGFWGGITVLKGYLRTMEETSEPADGGGTG